jgi:hypothetical protein
MADLTMKAQADPEDRMSKDLVKRRADSKDPFPSFKTRASSKITCGVTNPNYSCFNDLEQRMLHRLQTGIMSTFHR